MLLDFALAPAVGPASSDLSSGVAVATQVEAAQFQQGLQQSLQTQQASALNGNPQPTKGAGWNLNQPGNDVPTNLNLSAIASPTTELAPLVFLPTGTLNYIPHGETTVRPNQAVNPSSPLADAAFSPNQSQPSQSPLSIPTSATATTANDSAPPQGNTSFTISPVVDAPSNDIANHPLSQDGLETLASLPDSFRLRFSLANLRGVNPTVAKLPTDSITQETELAQASVNFGATSHLVIDSEVAVPLSARVIENLKSQAAASAGSVPNLLQASNGLALQSEAPTVEQPVDRQSTSIPIKIAAPATLVTNIPTSAAQASVLGSNPDVDFLQNSIALSDSLETIQTSNAATFDPLNSTPSLSNADAPSTVALEDGTSVLPSLVAATRSRVPQVVQGFARQTTEANEAQTVTNNTFNRAASAPVVAATATAEDTSIRPGPVTPTTTGTQSVFTNPTHQPGTAKRSFLDNSTTSNVIPNSVAIAGSAVGQDGGTESETQFAASAREGAVGNATSQFELGPTSNPNLRLRNQPENFSKPTDEGERQNLKRGLDGKSEGNSNPRTDSALKFDPTQKVVSLADNANALLAASDETPTSGPIRTTDEAIQTQPAKASSSNTSPVIKTTDSLAGTQRWIEDRAGPTSGLRPPVAGQVESSSISLDGNKNDIPSRTPTNAATRSVPATNADTNAVPTSFQGQPKPTPIQSNSASVDNTRSQERSTSVVGPGLSSGESNESDEVEPPPVIPNIDKQNQSPDSTIKVHAGTRPQTPVASPHVRATVAGHAIRPDSAAKRSDVSTSALGEIHSVAPREESLVPTNAFDAASFDANTSIDFGPTDSVFTERLTARSGGPALSQAEGTQSRAGTDRSQVVHQVLSVIQQATESNERLRVHLNPPELGSVLVEVARHPQGIVAKIEFTNAVTQQTVTSSLPDLQQSLARSGVVVDRVEVVIRDSSTPNEERPRGEQRRHQQQQSFGQSQQRQQQQQRPSRPELSEEESDAA